MEKYIAFGLYRKNEQGAFQPAGAPSLQQDVYLASDVDKLIQAARATLCEQRREFARGDVADLDALEDALGSLMESST
jgi:hypothetical protein